jgi:hypothetical protein
MADRAFLERLTKQLANEGKLIEAGWVAMRLAAIPDNAPAIQLQEMRLAYMAGAQHLFASMIAILDDDREPTDADMARMDLIHKELEAFRSELELWVAKTKGRG